jgi:hypothetical protein
MPGERDLQTLIRSMSPQLKDETYVFATSPDGFPLDVLQDSTMTFREPEGLTLVVPETSAKKHGMPFQDRWALITLNVHSDLQAIGFLAAITNALAQAEISVNAVSAFFHDHLFVPWDKRMLALETLESLSKQ